MKKECVIEGRNGKPVSFDLNWNEKAEQQPLVVFAHGFKGFKDWGTFNAIADHFVANGFAFLKLNFSYNGVSPDNLVDFVDLEAFGNNTFSKEMDDFDAVFDWVQQELKADKTFDTTQLTLIGFSRGGGVAVVEAAENPAIKKLVTWAAVGDFRSRYSAVQIEAWKKEGVLYIPNARTGQQMPLYSTLYTDFIENEERFTIQKAAEKLTIPTLVVHGLSDETVAVKDAENLHQWIAQSSLHLVENAGHTFNGKHPWNEQEMLPKETLELLKQTIDFLQD